MPATRAPTHQWLVLEPNWIETQYWKDLWHYRELFAILDLLLITGICQFRRIAMRFADAI